MRLSQTRHKTEYFLFRKAEGSGPLLSKLDKNDCIRFRPCNNEKRKVCYPFFHKHWQQFSKWLPILVYNNFLFPRNKIRKLFWRLYKRLSDPDGLKIRIRIRPSKARISYTNHSGKSVTFTSIESTIEEEFIKKPRQTIVVEFWGKWQPMHDSVKSVEQTNL